MLHCIELCFVDVLSSCEGYDGRTIGAIDGCGVRGVVHRVICGAIDGCGVRGIVHRVICGARARAMFFNLALGLNSHTANLSKGANFVSWFPSSSL